MKRIASALLFIFGLALPSQGLADGGEGARAIGLQDVIESVERTFPLLKSAEHSQSQFGGIIYFYSGNGHGA